MGVSLERLPLSMRNGKGAGGESQDTELVDWCHYMLLVGFCFDCD